MLRESADSQDLQIEESPCARRPLRVAVVTETFPPEVNGVAMTLSRLVGGMREAQHDVQLIRPRQTLGEEGRTEPRFHEVLMRGLPVPRYPDLRMGVPSKRALVRLWSMRRPDVVHIATEGPLGWSALQASRHLKLPVTSDFRTNFHAYSQHYGVGWLRKPIMGYLRKFHNATARTFVPTQALLDDLRTCGLRNLEVVGRGVDTLLFDPCRRDEALRRRWGAQPQDPVLLCVGRLAPEKNLDLLLQVFAAARASRPQTRLVLVGDGPLRAALHARCPDAVFAGQRSGVDLAAHYASADFFIFPSCTETFGNVVTEAMASALPVVAFRRAAAQELIRQGENGLLVDGSEPVQFIDVALQALRDREAATRMGQTARLTALGVSWESVVQRFENELRGVVARHVISSCVDLAKSGWPSPVR